LHLLRVSNVCRKQARYLNITNANVVKQIVNIKELQSYSSIEPSAQVLETLEAVERSVQHLVRQPLLYTNVPLDGRLRVIRSQETNLGNLLADAVRAFYDTDVALVNSGSVRCDRVVSPTRARGSPLSMRDLVGICPFDNAFVVKRIKGDVLLDALENSVSDAHTDGRFLQFSGLRIKAAWKRQECKRILQALFVPQDHFAEDVDPERTYTVAMVDFIASGFDGYTCFKEATSLIDEEGAMTDTNLLLTIFRPASNGDITTPKDETWLGIERARATIIKDYDTLDGLPIINPAVEGRIDFLNYSRL
jgi:2',3'-cyclic-nucleotide 2'-phosphodiesterase (5'-nucleotidase family)